MKKFLSRNIDNGGRWIRGCMALGFFIGAGFAFAHSLWLAVLLGVGGVFTAFEALRGWCVMRACGVKTKY